MLTGLDRELEHGTAARGRYSRGSQRWLRRVQRQVSRWLLANFGQAPRAAADFAMTFRGLEPLEPRVLLSSSVDLLVTNTNGDFPITISKNLGDGAFEPAENIGTDVSQVPGPLGAGDFDGDGDIDLVFGKLGGFAISIAKNLGDGTFLNDASSLSGTAGAGVTQPAAIAVGDFNGDGLDDIAVANRGQGSVAIFGGNNAVYLARDASRIYTVGAGPEGIATGDIDGDGDLDLVVSNKTAGTLNLLLNDGEGHFTVSDTVLNAGNEPTTVLLADLNGGGLDILVLNSGDDNVGVLLNNGNGTFGTMSATNVDGNVSDMAAGLLNGDGHVDVVVSQQDNDTVALLAGDGTGGFSGTTSLATDNRPGAIAIGDVTGDGHNDIVVTTRRNVPPSPEPDAVNIFASNGAGGFGAHSDVIMGDDFYELILIDLDFVGEPAPGTIAGNAWNDLNDNIFPEAGEPDLAGRKIYLDLNENGVLDEGDVSTDTDEAGNFSFTVMPGTYQVRQIVPEGWEETRPAPGFYTAEVVPGAVRSNYFFGSRNVDAPPLLASVAGTVYDDLDGDGVRDEGEAGLSGWTVYLDADNDGILDDGEVTTLTNGSGAYSFTELEAITYHVRVVPLDDLVQTAPDGAPPVNLTPGANATLDFGFATESSGGGDGVTLDPANPRAIVPDSMGNDATVVLVGPGSLELVEDESGDIDLLLTGSTLATTVYIVGTPGQPVVFDDLTVNGASVGRIIGLHASLTGDLTVADGYAALVQLDDMAGGSITFGGAATDVTRLVFRDLADVSLTSGASIALLHARSYVNAADQTIEAPVLLQLRVAGDLETDIVLDNPLGQRFAMIGAVAGGTLSGQWTVQGSVHQIAAAGEASDFTLDIDGNLTAARLKDAGTTNITADIVGGIVAAAFDGSITADFIAGLVFQSFTGTIEADQINLIRMAGDFTGTLTTGILGAMVARDFDGDIAASGAIHAIAVRNFNGTLAAASLNAIRVTGNFDGDVTLTGDAPLLLRQAAIFGDLSGMWQIGGTAHTIAALGTVDNFDLELDGDLYALALGDVADASVVSQDGFVLNVRATRWLDGVIEADLARNIVITGNARQGIAGDFGADLLLRGAAAGATLGVLNVFGVLGRPDDMATRSVLDIDGHATAIAANQFNRVDIRLGVSGFGADAAEYIDNEHVLGAIAVRQQPAQAGTVDTLISAYAIGQALLGTIQPDNGGVPFGVRATSIGRLIGLVGTTPLREVRLTEPGEFGAQDDFAVEIFDLPA